MVARDGFQVLPGAYALAWNGKKGTPFKMRGVPYPRVSQSADSSSDGIVKGTFLSAADSDRYRQSGPWVMTSEQTYKVPEMCTCESFTRDQLVNPYVVWYDDKMDLPDDSICQGLSTTGLTSDPSSQDRTKDWTDSFKDSCKNGGSRRRAKAGTIAGKGHFNVGNCFWKGDPASTLPLVLTLLLISTSTSSSTSTSTSTSTSS